ncbi:MAG: glycoside hydrolase family 38 C-terminal domain-containing protein [Promethearchaeota archaeon]
MPSGESLIRQRIAGQYFYLENFGFMSEIAWLDDVFGFSFQLPQILAKCNAKYFLTNKFCYNDTNKWPYHALRWRGPDGSEVILTWNQHKNNWQNYLTTFRDLSVMFKKEINPEDFVMNYMTDFEKVATVKKNFDDNFLPYTVNVYGHGDGGHAPRLLEILEQLCWEDNKLVKLGTMKDWFEIIEKFRDRLPIWQDELYLENHRGTLTTINMIKENNKTSEVLLHAIEFLNVINLLIELKKTNQQKEKKSNPTSISSDGCNCSNGMIDFQSDISELWKPVLFNQFHDVLPGSSIIEVYRDAAQDYKRVYKRLYEIYEFIFKRIEKYLLKSNYINSDEDSNNISKEHVANDPFISLGTILTVNNLSWSRGGIITIPLKRFNVNFNEKTDEIIAMDLEGNEYPCFIMDFPFYDFNRELIGGLGEITGENYLRNPNGLQKLIEYNNPQTNNKFLWILVPYNSYTKLNELNLKKSEIKPFEFKILNLICRKSKSMKINQQNTEDNSNNNLDLAYISNDLLKIKIKINSAEIIEVIDKSSKINCIKSIKLQLFNDPKTKFDAWNIHPDYYKNPINMPKFELVNFFSSRDAGNNSINSNKDNNNNNGQNETNNINENDSINEKIIEGIVLKSEKTESGSTIFIKIFMLKSDPTIYFDISTDWQEDHKLLKFVVEPAFKSKEIYSGLQYGYIKRSSVPNNQFTQYRAKFEYPNQQWSCVFGKIEDQKYCIGILNRNKYGIFAMGSKMMLSLEKAANFEKYKSVATLDDDNPRPNITDLGFNRFSAAVHITKSDQITVATLKSKGDLNTNNSQYSKNGLEELDMLPWRRGYEYNFPLISYFFNSNMRQLSIGKKSQQLQLQEKLSNLFFLDISNLQQIPNIFIGAIKSAENPPKGKNNKPEWFLKNHLNESNNAGNLYWIVLRIAEIVGKKTTLKLKTKNNFEIQDVKELDMLERIISSNNCNNEPRRNTFATEKIFNGNQIDIQIKPHEIKTLGILLKSNINIKNNKYTNVENKE